MAKQFDKDYWDLHWREAGKQTHGSNVVSHLYLESELHNLEPGTALDAGCGEGAEAIWLASRGWQVTAVDISAEALSRAQSRAEEVGVGNVHWVEADLSDWEPGKFFDLVISNYAHPAMSQLAFYERISNWVAPGGNLQVIGHRDLQHSTDVDNVDSHGDTPLEATLVTAESVSKILDFERWDIVTADEPSRVVLKSDGRSIQLSDVVVRAIRRTVPINSPSALFEHARVEENS